MKRYRIREVTVGRYVKQQTRYYPQWQPAGNSTDWFNFDGNADNGFTDEVYFTAMPAAEQFLDVNVEAEVIHEYLPTEVDMETRFTTSIARDDTF